MLVFGNTISVDESQKPRVQCMDALGEFHDVELSGDREQWVEQMQHAELVYKEAASLMTGSVAVLERTCPDSEETN